MTTESKSTGVLEGTKSKNLKDRSMSIKGVHDVLNEIIQEKIPNIEKEIGIQT